MMPMFIVVFATLLNGQRQYEAARGWNALFIHAFNEKKFSLRERQDSVGSAYAKCLAARRRSADFRYGAPFNIIQQRKPVRKRNFRLIYTYRRRYVRPHDFQSEIDMICCLAHVSNVLGGESHKKK